MWVELAERVEYGNYAFGRWIFDPAAGQPGPSVNLRTKVCSNIKIRSNKLYSNEM